MSGHRTRGLCALVLASAIGSAAAQGERFAMVSVDEPRAFGYQVGDVVSRRLVLELPSGVRLDEASLPTPGGRGKATELVAIERDSRWSWHGRQPVLSLRYQVFLSPTAPRTLDLPSLRLRFVGGEREQEVLVDAWPLVVSPLASTPASNRRGLGELRPDAAPPDVPTDAVRQRLVVYGAAALLVAAYLAHVYLALPWWAARRRPFTLAARRWPREPRAALRAIHQALDATAGEAVFAAALPRFVAAHPQFSPLADDLRDFFERSSNAFFGTEEPPADTLAWLQALCRRCSAAERGAA